LAEAAVDKISPFFEKIGPSWTKNVPLMGGDFTSHQSLTEALTEQYPWLDVVVRDRFVRSYGTLAHQILSSCRTTKDMGKDFGAGLYECEVQYLINSEWAQSSEDVLWRRTKLGLRLSNEEQRILSDFISSSITRTDLIDKKASVIS
jgi:glycerol-3-phosphate dehydrogenase